MHESNDCKATKEVIKIAAKLINLEITSANLIRHALYKGIVLLGLLIFSDPIWQLAQLSRHSELYSHFMLIPMVSLFFVWVDRKVLFEKWTNPG